MIRLEDKRIVELYWERCEDAIAETEKKYGRYCHYIAYNILYSDLDAQECVNDTYIKAWGAMPPHKPERLSAFLGKITRNIALNRYSHNNAEKRRANTELILREAGDFIPSYTTDGAIDDEIVLKDAINKFLASLPQDTRIVFVRRYWYFSTVKDIASDYGIPEGTVKSVLSRTRKRFKDFLVKEGIRII